MGCFRLKSVRCDDMKLKSLLWVCLLLMALCACSDNVVEKQYTIYKEDGKTYAEFLMTESDDGDTSDGALSCCIAKEVVYPMFGSAAEMKEKILSGEIPEERLSGLRAQADENNVLEIMDLNNIYELRLPEGMRYNYVRWYGKQYLFDIGTIGNGEAWGVVTWGDRDYYDRQYSDKLSHLNFEDVTIITDSVVADRNARVIHFTNFTGEYKELIYDVATPAGTVRVLEHYTLDHYEDRLAESKTVPDMVQVFGDQSGQCFYGYFWDINERPSLEWFASFALDPV